MRVKISKKLMRSNNMLIFFLDDQTLKTSSFTEQRNDGFVMTWKRLQADEAIEKQTNEIYTDRQTDRESGRRTDGQTDRHTETDRQSSERVREVKPSIWVDLPYFPFHCPGLVRLAMGRGCALTQQKLAHSLIFCPLSYRSKLLAV